VRVGEVVETWETSGSVGSCIHNSSTKRVEQGRASDDQEGVLLGVEGKVGRDVGDGGAIRECSAERWLLWEVWRATRAGLWSSRVRGFAQVERQGMRVAQPVDGAQRGGDGGVDELDTFESHAWRPLLHGMVASGRVGVESWMVRGWSADERFDGLLVHVLEAFVDVLGETANAPHGDGGVACGGCGRSSNWRCCGSGSGTGSWMDWQGWLRVTRGRG